MSEFNTSKKIDLLARAMAIRAIPKPSITLPTDKTLLWLDSNTAPYSLKYYDPNLQSWIAIKGFDDPDYNPAYPEVSNFESLPPANEHIGQIYVVLQSTGIYLINRHERGLYFSNGATWTRLGNIPEYFRDDIFEIYDNDEPTRAVQFQVGNVSKGVRLHAHTWMSDHWDITQVFNVKRLATGYFNNSITVNNTNWMYVANDGILIYDNVKRFVPYLREGQT